MWNRLGAGFLCVLGRYGTPWMRLKEIPGRRCRCGAARRASKARTPRVYEAIGNVPAALRREISAAHRSCGGNRIPEPARCRLFCVQSRKRAALDAEGDPRLSVPMRCRQEST
nr:hypothetical protein [Bacillus velezensis]